MNVTDRRQAATRFLTHVDSGCKDGVHKAWFTAEVDNKHDALSIVPADYRAAARIIMLTQFTAKDLDKISKSHGGNRESKSTNSD